MSYFVKHFLDTDFFDMLADEFFFNSSVKDMKPYVIYKKDGNYIIEVKTLGINEDDISIKLDDDVLEICGETKNEFSNIPFNIKLKLRMSDKVVNSLKEINYKVKNGLTYIYLKMIEPKSSKIKINKIN